MKITEMQLYSAVNEFIDHELMPLAATMDLPKQFMFGFKLGIVKRRLESVIKSYINSSSFDLFELIDANGYIDIEPMYQAAVDMMSKMQFLELGGITFKQNDLQKLYSIMQRYAV